MDKILEITLLYDFYGELLTERQKEMFEMYYLEDLSLSEIGERLNISRQAVRDSLKHSRESLENYEEKLSLVERFSKEKVSIMRICEIMDNLEKELDLSEEAVKQIKEIKQLADGIIDF